MQPKLRFKGFTENWKSSQINQITSYVDYRGKTPKKVDSGTFLVTAKNVRMGYIDYENSQEYIAEDDYENVMSRGKPQMGDVLITTEAPMGNIASVDRNGIALAQRIIKLRGVESILDNGFLKYRLLSTQFQHELSALSSGGTVKGIKGSVLHKMQVSIPAVEEQTKIASFLSAVDEKISQLTKKHELLAQYKKGLMQKIFSQKLRFRADDGSDYPDWEESNLGGLCNITTGKLDANAMVINGKYRFYTCAKNYFFIDNYAFDTEALLISGNGANVGYIHYFKGQFNAYQRTYVLDNFEKNILFIKYYLDHHLHSRIHSDKKEGNTPYIVMSTLSEMEINLPSNIEQSKIANFLSDIDNKIQNTQLQLDTIKQYKQGLLQQMFV